MSTASHDLEENANPSNMGRRRGASVSSSLQQHFFEKRSNLVLCSLDFIQDALKEVSQATSVKRIPKASHFVSEHELAA